MSPTLQAALLKDESALTASKDRDALPTVR
jgi:hypothetical protein